MLPRGNAGQGQHHQCNAAYASTLSEFFLPLGALFFGLSTCPPKCLCTCLVPTLVQAIQTHTIKNKNKTRLNYQE